MCGTPSLNYLSRVVPPGNLREASLLFDGWARDAFTTKHNIATECMPDWAWKQLSLPMKSGGMSLRQYAATGQLSFWAAFAGASKFFIERDLISKFADDGWMSKHIQGVWSKISGKLTDTLTGPGKPLVPKTGQIREVANYYAAPNVENEAENVDVSRHLQTNLFKY